MTATRTPGLAVALVRGDQILVAKGYGYADVASKRRVDSDTAFYVASVGKIVTATVLMLLLEDGAFALDDPVSRCLDFPLSHPRYPNVSITFRHLLTHTSGISDQQLFSTDPSALPPELRDFLVSYLTPSGHSYSADRCFGAVPGSTWSYCNVGYALLGYLVGLVGSGPLDRVSDRRLFAPLGMKNTAWRYAGLEHAQIAERYGVEKGQLTPLPRASYPDWPDGLLVTSAADFAKLLRVFTQGGANTLKPQTVARMLAPESVTVDKHDPLAKQALMWELHSQHNLNLATKSGNDAGATAFVAFDAAHHTAALVFANTTSSPH